ncbi:MAG: extracellular solute-binding protein [Holosporales bacterium]|nr:extracellular solute-binding protein [Holosporales bacterium]
MSKKEVVAGVYILMIFLFFYCTSKDDGQNIVYVYGWHGVITKEVMEGFRKETGIKVVYDVYDNNCTLEAKLLATNCEYDVVFPSFIPFAARQCSMGVFSKLNKSWLPNLKNISGQITEKYIAAGGDIEQILPIFWGTIGIAYDVDKVAAVLPAENIDSYEVLFDADKAKKLSRYGISFPEEHADIFPQMRAISGLPVTETTKSQYRAIEERFRPIRQYIKKFSSNSYDLITGEVCLFVGSSDNAWRAQKMAKAIKKKIRYTVPMYAGNIWIDCAGIPQKSTHKRNAHIFLNYLLRSDVAAKLTNQTGIIANVRGMEQFLNPEITSDPEIYQTDTRIIDKLVFGNLVQSEHDMQNERLAMRTWAKIKKNAIKHEEAKNE